MSRLDPTLEKWAARVADAGHASKTLARRIAANGPPTGEHNLTRPMSEPLANNLLVMLREGAVAGSHGRLYLVDLLRWHVGYDTAPAYSTAKLTPGEAAFIRRRAYELVDAHRGHLPPLTRDHQAT